MIPVAICPKVFRVFAADRHTSRFAGSITATSPEALGELRSVEDGWRYEDGTVIEPPAGARPSIVPVAVAMVVSFGCKRFVPFSCMFVCAAGCPNRTHSNELRRLAGDAPFT